jgi:hypothetical protein
MRAGKSRGDKRVTGSALLFLGLMSTKMNNPTINKISSSIIFRFVDFF